MATNIAHKNISDANRHEPKGASSASVNTVLTSNGDGTTSFTAGAMFGKQADSSSPTQNSIPLFDGTNFQAVPMFGYDFKIDNQYTSSAKRSITGGTRTKVTINGGAVSRQYPSDQTYWNTTSNKIVGSENTMYVVAISFIANSGSANTYVSVEFDSGGSTGSFFTRTLELVKGTSTDNNITVTYPLFVGTDFAANGAEVYVTPNNNTDFWDFTVSLFQVCKGIPEIVEG